MWNFLGYTGYTNQKKTPLNNTKNHQVDTLVAAKLFAQSTPRGKGPVGKKQAHLEKSSTLRILEMSNSPVLRPQNCHERKIWCFHSFGVRILREIHKLRKSEDRTSGRKSKKLEKSMPFQLSWKIFFRKVIWLVVSTHLKNISQNKNLPQVGVKIKKYLKPPSRWFSQSLFFVFLPGKAFR